MKNSLIILLFGLTSTISTAKNCDIIQSKASHSDYHAHIEKEEKSKGIESGLLKAIGHIESRLTPYSVNVNGDSHFFKTATAAIQFIKTKQNQGYYNISVGLMQLHLPSHRQHFNSLEEMFDHKKNISYAAKLLARLIRKTGCNEKAVKMYHTGKPHSGEEYKNRVFKTWKKHHNPVKIKFSAGAMIQKKN